MAKRFVFRLKPVLKLRQARRREQQRVLADWLRRLQRCGAEIAELEARVSDARQMARASRRTSRVDAATQVQGLRWRERLGRRIAQKRVLQSELERGVAGAREELARRSTELKAMENLRRRRFEEYRREAERTETNELNEVATQTFVRSRRGNEGSTASDDSPIWNLVGSAHPTGSDGPLSYELMMV